jgi:hypothetical protein
MYSANYTEKPLLDFVSDTIESGKFLKNVALVLNNVKIAGYGNKYAYSMEWIKKNGKVSQRG